MVSHVMVLGLTYLNRGEVLIELSRLGKNNVMKHKDDSRWTKREVGEGRWR